MKMKPTDYEHLSAIQAIAYQNKLRKRIRIEPLEKQITTIAGADISFNKYSEVVYAGIVLFTYPELKIIGQAHLLVNRIRVANGDNPTIMFGVLIYLGYGGLIAGVIVSAKFIGFACAVSYHYYMYSNSLYYFRNAGLSIRRLYIYSFCIDFALTIFLILIFILMSHVYIKG